MNAKKDTLKIKAAFAFWNNRIAPVFDTARQILVVEAQSGHIITQGQESLSDDLAVQKALRLTQWGVTTLVCGAISRPLQNIISGYGIDVIAFVAGDLPKVLEAWLGGSLKRDDFAMPGCCRRSKRQRRVLCERHREGHLMNKGIRGGMVQGGGQNRGRMGRHLAAGPVEACLCPKCGHNEPHERGVPCVKKLCPKCGTAMTRN